MAARVVGRAAARVTARGKGQLFRRGEVKVWIVVDQAQAHGVYQLFELLAAGVLCVLIASRHKLGILEFLVAHLFLQAVKVLVKISVGVGA